MSDVIIQDDRSDGPPLSLLPANYAELCKPYIKALALENVASNTKEDPQYGWPQQPQDQQKDDHAANVPASVPLVQEETPSLPTLQLPIPTASEPEVKIINLGPTASGAGGGSVVAVSKGGLESMSLRELKSLCMQYKVSQSGSKKDLMARLSRVAQFTAASSAPLAAASQAPVPPPPAPVPPMAPADMGNRPPVSDPVATVQVQSQQTVLAPQPSGPQS